MTYAVVPSGNGGGGGAGGPGVMTVIQFSIGTAPTTDSVTAVPAGAFVYESIVDIEVPYPPGTTIEVGQTVGPADSFQSAADNDPTTLVDDGYAVSQVTASAGGAPVRATVGGAPGSGQATITIKWARPEA